MDTVILLASAALLLLAIKYHAMTHAHVIKKIERSWFERLWTGSRPAKENLTDEGLQYRKKSNTCAISGFVMLGFYIFLS